MNEGMNECSIVAAFLFMPDSLLISLADFAKSGFDFLKLKNK
jgi:hypothetical protein